MTSLSLAARWRAQFLGPVDLHEVIDRVHDEARWSGRYLFMLIVSAAIAELGLLLSSPAVVIGAMLISPLMGPIIGLGFALATVDAPRIRRASAALVGGAVAAVAFCALLVLASPIQTVTAEIAARTRPNLFDLLVALFSALAGSYATIRGRQGTVVGVAIATALMPPLATVGFGLATGNMTVLSGALLLFVTNFVTIALTAAVMARIYGFGSRLSPHQTVLQLAAVAASLAVLAVPLGVSLRRIAWESAARTQAREVLSRLFGSDARVSQLDLDLLAHPVVVSATVLTPQYRRNAPAVASAALTRALGRPVRAKLDQFRVGTGPGAAESAAIKAAQAPTTPDAATAGGDTGAGADPAGNALARRLALVAGVDTGQVLLDRDARRARVVAGVLPGARIAAYHLLEMRVAATVPDWQVELVPPSGIPLAPVGFAGTAPDEAGRAALAEAIWGARRTGLALTVRGPRARVSAVLAVLSAAGVPATRAGSGSGAVRLGWTVPATPAAASPPVPAPGPSPAPAPAPAPPQ